MRDLAPGFVGLLGAAAVASLLALAGCTFDQRGLPVSSAPDGAVDDPADDPNDVPDPGADAGPVTPPDAGVVSQPDAAPDPCAGGVCDCPMPLERCGGFCVDTDFNDDNCGGCGDNCRGGDICYQGRCERYDSDVSCDSCPCDDCDDDECYEHPGGGVICVRLGD